MAKLTLSDVSNLMGNPTSAANTLNANAALIETALENTLSRDGTSPNEMNASLDMNSQRIMNLPAPAGANDPVRLQDVTSGLIDFEADAASITFDPTATISATNVQDAIEEVALEAGLKVFNVQSFGAVGDGTTDDSTAIQAACAACAAEGGGWVYCPPTGAAYVASNILLDNGVILMGAGNRVFPGETGTVAQWTDKGSWIRSASAVNPTVTLNGHGSGIIGMNFIRNQVTPGVGAYTPTTFPYEIKIFATFFVLDNIMTVGTTHDIWIAYTSLNGGGTYSRMHNLFLGALQVGIKFDNVNDCLDIRDIDMRSLFYPSTASMVTYVMANRIGWDVGYLDNPRVNGVQFFHCFQAMKFTDQTCLGNTHSMFNAQLENVQFNLVTHAMSVAAGDTAVTGLMSNILAQTGPGFGPPLAEDLFVLTSSDINLTINNLVIRDAGSRAIVLGDGTSGHITIDNLVIDSYSSGIGGSAAVDLASSATMDVGNWTIATPGGTPGPKFQGGNIVFTRHPNNEPLMWRNAADSADISAMYVDTGNNLILADTGGVVASFKAVVPVADDGAALGRLAPSVNQWSDLFLAEGGVINWDNGDLTLTQAGDILTVAGGDLRVTTAGTNAASAVTVGGTQTLTNKTLTSPTLTAPLTVANGGTGVATSCVYASVNVAAVNFNSVADTAINVVLPSGFTKYRIQAIILHTPSAAANAAQFGLFTAAAGGGTAVIPATACSLTTASLNTTGSLQALNPTIQATMDDVTLFFRITTAHGSAATASVLLQIQPLP